VLDRCVCVLRCDVASFLLLPSVITLSQQTKSVSVASIIDSAMVVCGYQVLDGHKLFHRLRDG